MVSTHAHNKLGYLKWRPRLYSCQTVVLLTQWFTFIFPSITANTLQDSNSRRIYNAYALVKSLAVNRTKTHISLPNVSAGHMCKADR